MQTRSRSRKLDQLGLVSDLRQENRELQDQTVGLIKNITDLKLGNNHLFKENNRLLEAENEYKKTIEDLKTQIAGFQEYILEQNSSIQRLNNLVRRKEHEINTNDQSSIKDQNIEDLNNRLATNQATVFDLKNQITLLKRDNEKQSLENTRLKRLTADLTTESNTLKSMLNQQKTAPTEQNPSYKKIITRYNHDGTIAYKDIIEIFN